MKWIRGGLVFGVVFLSGCGSGTDGTPSGGVQSVLTKGLDLPPGTNAVVAVKSTAAANATNAKSYAPLAQGTPGVALDTAMILLKEIKLELLTDSGQAGDDVEGDDEEENDDVELEGPFLVDLVDQTVQNLGHSNLDDDSDDDGVSDVDDDDDDGDGELDADDNDDDSDGVPDEEDQTVGETRLFDALELPPGTYGRVRFKVAPLEQDDAPHADHPMMGLSVLASGSMDGVPFEYCGSFEATFALDSSEGIVVDTDAVATFLVTVDPLGWFADLDLSVGTLSDDGVLRICGDSNVELGDMIRAAISQRARLGRDEDGDGDDDDDLDGDLEDDDHNGDSDVDDHDGGDEHDDDLADPSTDDEDDDAPADPSTGG